MNRMKSFFLPVISMLLMAACEQQSAQDEVSTTKSGTEPKPYIVLEESLQRLKDDFNANRGRIRLLFIVGDACGICLRGMADLNDAFIAQAQNDERLVTFVLHVPALGTEEKHVAAAIPLMNGPRILHYWDGVGKSGIHFAETLEIGDMYAWDVWLAYGPDAQWLKTVPPKPEFWMHQLPLDRDLRLDAGLFAEKTLALMENIEPGSFAELIADEAMLIADGTVIPTVAQPRSVAISTHIRRAGGYKNLVKIQTIRQSGTIEWASGTAALEIIQDRDSGLSRNFRDDARPLGDIENTLAAAWEMNGPLVDWKDKGHQIRIKGMLKVGKSLAWKLFLRQANGLRWEIYIDSHSGDIVLANHFNDSGATLFSIRASDFREIDGFRLPFKVEYLDAEGKLIATENFQQAEILIN